MDEKTIGWIGLGRMGTGMASLMCQHVHHSAGGRLLVFNRTELKSREFAASHPGAHIVSHPKDLSKQCHITFSCLANDDALKASFHDFIKDREPTNPPCIFVDSSTVLPDTTRYLAALAAEHGVIFCHAPVFGRPDAAAAGKLLSYISGGDDKSRTLAAGLAGTTYAQNGVHDLGNDITSATKMKLLGNCYIISQVEIAAECLTLGEAAGLPQSSVLNLLQYMVGNAPIPSGYARRMATGDYSAGAGFTVELAMKDLSHIQTLSRESGAPVPTANTAMENLISAKARYGGHLDWGALNLAVRDRAGLSSNDTMNL